MNDFKQDIRSHIVDNFLFGQEDNLQDDDSFLEHGIIDSTGVLQLVFHLEDRYGIKVEDDEMLPENLDSIEAICGYLERKKASAA